MIHDREGNDLEIISSVVRLMSNGGSKDTQPAQSATLKAGVHCLNEKNRQTIV